MRFLIQPRQYGKTYQLKQWFLEDPEGRVILMYSENTAAHHRATLEPDLIDKLGWELKDIRRLLRKNIVSWRTWRNSSSPYMRRAGNVEVAIDDISPIMEYLFKGNIRWIAGAGRNTEANPAQAAEVEAWLDKMPAWYREEEGR